MNSEAESRMLIENRRPKRRSEEGDVGGCSGGGCMAMAPRVRLDQDCRDAKLAAAACDPTLIGQLQELLRRLLVSQREIIGSHR